MLRLWEYPSLMHPRSLSYHASRVVRRAFTLVELMVVILIVITLASLTFLVVSRMRARADNVLAITNMRQIGLGIASYMSDEGHLPRFVGTGVSPVYCSHGNHSTRHANVLHPYLGLGEQTSTDQYAEIFRPPGLKTSNMSGKKNWYELTCYAMYSTNDVHKSKAYFPKGVMADSAGIDVGPFGRTGTGGNPTSEGWSPGVMDRALTKFSADNGGKIVDVSMIPAMLEINAEYPKANGSWPWPVPQKVLRGDHVNVLYFDWHVGSVKPDYFYKP